MDLARREVSGTEGPGAAPGGAAPASGEGGRATAARLALMALPLAFFGLFFAYPVGAIVGRGVTTDAG